VSTLYGREGGRGGAQGAVQRAQGVRAGRGGPPPYRGGYASPPPPYRSPYRVPYRTNTCAAASRFARPGEE
jgi:hypothetical protein